MKKLLSVAQYKMSVSVFSNIRRWTPVFHFGRWLFSSAPKQICFTHWVNPGTSIRLYVWLLFWSSSSRQHYLHTKCLRDKFRRGKILISWYPPWFQRISSKDTLCESYVYHSCYWICFVGIRSQCYERTYSKTLLQLCEKRISILYKTKLQEVLFLFC